MGAFDEALLSRWAVLSVQMKNCDLLVFFPLLAIERIPDPTCFNSKFSSLNFSPYIDFPPVPFPRVKSPLVTVMVLNGFEMGLKWR